MANRTSKQRRRDCKTKNIAQIRSTQDVEVTGQITKAIKPCERTSTNESDDVAMTVTVDGVDETASAITSMHATEAATTTDTEDAVNKDHSYSEQTESLFFSLLDKDCRIKIYDMMLSFVDNYRCQPQILAICKKLKEEANGILYGLNNIFDVKVITSGKTVWNPSRRHIGHLQDMGEQASWRKTSSLIGGMHDASQKLHSVGFHIEPRIRYQDTQISLNNNSTPRVRGNV